MEEHVRRYPPSDMLVPELMAHHIVYFLQANTAKEDRKALPKVSDFVPWSAKELSIEERIKKLDKEIAVLPADDEAGRNKLRREQARLLTEET